MKIIRNAVRHRESSRLKITLRMKLLLSLFFATLLQINAGLEDTRSQKITLDLKSATVLDVIREIETTTVYRFLYRSEELDTSRKMNIRAKNEKLESVLHKVFANSGMAYKIVEDQVVLTPKKLPSVDEGNNPPMVQQQNISGTVTDAMGPIFGVTIRIKSSNRGTLSNRDGYYKIMATSNDTLVFSFVGLKTVERVVGKQTIINVELTEDITSLEEVVLNAGYYKVTEKARTGSISRITSEDIQDQPLTNPIQALIGRVPGVEISPSTTPGAYLKIRVRGENSLTGKSGGGVTGFRGALSGGIPLYVVDGMPVASQAIRSDNFGDQDPLININPENIESIEVLKDADATAIYGSRGANGVILITTKKGTPGRDQFRISTYRGIGHVSKRFQLLNTEQYLGLRNEAIQNDGINLEMLPPILKGLVYPDLTVWDQNRYTDWQDVLLGGNSEITDVQGNFSGGSENMSYRMGGSFHREDLINWGDSYFARGTANLGLDYRSSNQRFGLSVALNYGVNKQEHHGQQFTIGTVLGLTPNAPSLYDENGEINWGFDEASGQYTFSNNPMIQQLRIKTLETKTLVSNMMLSYQLWKDSDLKLNLGYTTSDTQDNSQNPITSKTPGNINTVGDSDFGYNRGHGICIEPQWTLSFTKGQHKVSTLLGAQYQRNQSERILISATEYRDDAFLGSLNGAGSINNTSEFQSDYRYMAFFGRIGYQYKQRYILNLTGRRDGSSRFSPGNRFGNFGAVGAAWIFSDEKWVRSHVPFLSFGKLRGSYGTTGSDAVGDYMYYQLYSLESSGYENDKTLIPYNLHNPNFQWERTRKMEAAIELGLFDNRMQLQAAWYQNRASNQLIQRRLPYTTGFPGVVDNFSEAVVQNSGWEFVLGGNPVSSPNFDWNLSINLSTNRNILLSFPEIEDSSYRYVYEVGSPLAIQRLYNWTQVNPETGLHEFDDVDENGVLNEEDKNFYNDLQPDFIGGLTQQFRYKNLQLDLLFQFAKQQGRWLPPQPAMGERVNTFSSYYQQRWLQPGDITEVQRATTSTNPPRIAYGNAINSTLNIEDQSFIRLRTLGLSYDIPHEAIDKIGLQRFRLFARGQNLFVLSKATTADPETGYGMPLQRTISLGVDLTF
ncbi:SusC/RagA family TonB-linked outer membrane protein [Sinomicrobium oceani]|nr:SusC/RagA family TonB-linked outer membrane protein [Sinomicrobium oceani]